jgi:hypothetical protein
MTMTAPQAFQSLADVQQWLRTLAAGQQVELGSSNFAQAVAMQMFKVLPGSDPLALTVATAGTTDDGGTLSGNATVAGEAGCAVKLSFAADAADPLLVTIEIGLPSDYVWRPLNDFDFGFGGLTATIEADPAVVAANLAFSGQLVVSGQRALAAQLTLPAVPDADWTLSVTGTTGPSQSLLSTLCGGTDPLSVIGHGFGLDQFTLSGFRMAFSPTGGVSMFTLGLAYHTSWKPFGTTVFEVTGFEFDVNGHKPFGAASMQAIATAKTLIDDVPVDVSVHFPDAAIFAYLDAGAKLSVAKVFSGFQIKLPEGFPDIEIDVLSFGIYALDQAIDFMLSIDKPVPITDKIQFDGFHFDLGVAYQDGAFSGHGDLFAQFSLGEASNPTIVSLQGSYDSTGSLSLAGTVANLEIGHVITSIVSRFGVDRSKVPGAIDDLVLDLLTLTFDRAKGTDKFTFHCAGHTQVAGEKVQFAPYLTVTYDESTKAWELDAGGTLDLEDAKGIIEFRVDFVKSSTDTAISAHYASTDPLTFTRLAGIFGVDIEGVPPDLDLDLRELSVDYDFKVGNLAIGAKSANPYYGTATFLSQAASGTAPRQSVFLLKTAVELSLSQLPMVGDALAKIGQLALTDLEAAIASPAPIGPDAVAALNQSIARLGAGYPAIPLQGLPGRILLAATLKLGGSAPQQVSVPLLAPSSSGTFAAPATGGGGGTKWFQVQKSFGPVSVQKVGLRYAGNKLWALMNADLAAGPVDFGIIGLGIGSPVSSFEPHFTVDGITLSVAAGPASFSGALVGQLDPLDLYGELGLALPGFSIGAIGGYAQYQGHPSCFLYAVLDAALGGPAFFFVTGLAAGFGFNRSLVIPPVGQLGQFPLISWATGNGPSSTPGGDVGAQVSTAMTLLSDSGVVAPAIGEYWIAAGVQFTSFKLINSFALLTVKLGNEVEVDLLGLSTLSLPPEDPAPIAVAQLALAASFAPARQEISVMGQLTSASYLLEKSCHLSGGFAFCMWYGGKQAGDFVLSLGGYSPRFDKPSHYPDVPRLGLNWRVDDNLSVCGDEYFALTPSALMAGGGLSAVWSSGAIRAWFSVEADFLLLFNPLHYYISASIDLGASVKIDLWFTSFTISIHLGVSGEIWGPRFSGKVHVDLEIVSFTIGFGASQPSPPQWVCWDDFVANVLPSRPQDQRTLLRSGLTQADTGAPLVQINAPTGVLKNLAPVPGAALPLDWVVDGETLAIAVSSTVPLTDHRFSDDGNIALVADPDDHRQPNREIGVGPSNIGPAGLVSTLSIALGALVDEGATVYATQILASVPKAIWQQRELDHNGVPAGVDPMNGTTVDNALTGFMLVPQAPPPQPGPNIPIEYLLLTNDGPPIPVAWSTPVLPASDPFAQQTVHATIADALAVPNRATLIAAINNAGFRVNTQVDVSSLADAGAGALLWAPQLRYLGEAA